MHDEDEKYMQNFTWKTLSKNIALETCMILQHNIII
jgi:hypothetical protein